VGVVARVDAAAVAGGAPGLRNAAVLAAAGLAVIVGYSLYKPADEGVRGTVALQELRSGEERTVAATVTLDPPRAADAAEWLTVTAWQGDGLVVDRLERVGPGRYRSTEPIPVHGNWKALVRLHHGSSLTAIPIFLPRDRAIPAAEVPAPPRFTREFVADHEILQREQKASAPALTLLAYSVVVAIALSLLALLAWALHRLSAAGERPQPPRAVAQRTPAARRQAASVG
jgi:hypothetical protein